jgi:hypothetical protein
MSFSSIKIGIDGFKNTTLIEPTSVKEQPARRGWLVIINDISFCNQLQWIIPRGFFFRQDLQD